MGRGPSDEAVEVGRAATFAGITFVGGVGVLLAAERGSRDLS